MKTEEFLDELQTIQFDIPARVEINLKEERCVRISGEDFSIYIKLDDPYFRVQLFDKTIPKDLFDLIYEYVNTPLEERKEEKRYKLRLKNLHSNDYNFFYLCMYDYYSDEILITSDFIKQNESDDEFYYLFTQEDIDGLSEEILKHDWEYIEVELIKTN